MGPHCGVCLCAVVCACLNTQEPSFCLYLHAYLSNDVQAKLGLLLLNDGHNTPEHHVLYLHCSEPSLSFGDLQTEIYSWPRYLLWDHMQVT